MTIQSKHFTLYAGDSALLQVTTRNSDGSRVDLSGSDLFWVLSKTVSEAPDVTKDSSGNGISVTDAEQGEFQIELVPSDTEALSGNFYHEAELRDPTGNEITIFVGDLTIKKTAI